MIGYNGLRYSPMRTPKKHLNKQQSDQEVERLYRNIPAGYGSNPSSEPDQIDVQPKPKSPAKKFFKRLIICIIVIALAYGAWVGWKFVANGVRIFGWDGLWSLFTTRELKGEADGRVNILLAGNSSDDVGHNGAELTDSIMVVSINTRDKTGYVMSIPRDLYVNIPNNGYAKINEAYQDGERDAFAEAGYPNGGMGLLEKTVSDAFGIDIHYYALVNYAALRDSVNAVGGITITVDSSDPRGLYDPSIDYANNQLPLVSLPNGPAELDGAEALGLARARGQARGSYGFATSDFARTEHQRQILLGLKTKASSASTLSNPIKVGELFDAFGSNVSTDLKMGEAYRLYRLSQDVPDAKFASASLNDVNGENLLMSYRTRSGQSALVPRAGVDDYTEIQTYISSL